MADKVRFKPGHVEDKNNKNVKTLNDGLKIEADCGFGIDACNKRFVIGDQSNGNNYELIFDGGVLKFRIHKSDDAYTNV